MKTLSVPELSETLIAVSHRVEEKGFVAATDGNISVRLPNGNILTTPTALNKGQVQIDDLVEVTPDGKRIRGTRGASSELKMHLFIYQQRSNVHAVVHCHPVYATGFAAAGVPLKENVFPEIIIGFGTIPLAQYATPSTDDVRESIRPFVLHHDALLLANHGVVTYGKDLWDAYYKMEKVEHTAHTLFVSEMIGGAKQLTPENVLRLNELTKSGLKK